MKVAIIGGGAAGCFCAIQLKSFMPDVQVKVYEAADRLLAKVAVTGGGRCNLTNTFQNLPDLKYIYPRGEKLIKRTLMVFSAEDTMRWFERVGVKLKVQKDGCVFPASEDARQIVKTLIYLMQALEVEIAVSAKVRSVEKIEIETADDTAAEEDIVTEEPQKKTEKRKSRKMVISEIAEGIRGYSESSLSFERFKYNIVTKKNNRETQKELFDAVVVATGGNSHGFLRRLNLEIDPPVPSLFTFNITDENQVDGAEKLTELQGTVVENVNMVIAGTRLKSHGALLITHWGMSGPAILKLSSYAARFLANKNYNATLVINWMPPADDDYIGDFFRSSNPSKYIEEVLTSLQEENLQSKIVNTHLPPIPTRLWRYLILKAGLREDIRWAELGSKGKNNLINTILSDTYTITGKGSFKEEFVTCGGVALSNIDLNTLESKQHPNLYFAGEILDIDGITGGFNLQAAWSTGFVAAHSISRKMALFL